MSNAAQSDQPESDQPESGQPESGQRAARERRWYFAIPVSLWVVAAFAAVTFVLAIAGYAITMILQKNGVSVDQNVYGVVLSAIIYVAVLAAVLGFPRLFKLWSARVRYRELLGLTRLMTWRDIIYAVLGAIVYILIFLGVTLLLQHLIPAYDAMQKQETGFSNILSPSNAVLVFFALVVVAPVAEEIIFRGYLFGTLRRCLPLIIAAVFTSALFGLVHGQWNVGIDVFVMSLVSCYLRVKTGALWSSFLLHMIKNGFAFYLLYVATSSIM